ncbi:hypothetical protein [Nesterenkonia sp. Act20]|uniref:hypothetical protein n=1 Tax=Nesterenkonia sp. Act20 TaxID=1483432 RepID=UPI001C48069A|nr:hypothetical protein [Nesterenkonia sp. Act20]
MDVVSVVQGEERCAERFHRRLVAWESGTPGFKAMVARLEARAEEVAIHEDS